MLQRIKGDSRTHMILVVIRTSSREEHDIIESDRLCVTSYITKPVNFEECTEAVRALGMYWVRRNQPPALAG